MKQPVLALGFLLFACGSSEEPTPSNTTGGGAGGATGGNAMVAGNNPGGAGSGGATGGSAAGGESTAGAGGGVTGGAAGEGTGGVSGGTAGAGGVSGGTAGAGGGTAGAGGAMTGGFKCPDGSSTLTPTLPSSVPEGTTPPGAGSGNLEGPVWIAGALYASEFALTAVPTTRIFRFVPGTGWDAQPFINDAGTNGLAVDNAGNLIGALHKDGSISRFNLASPAAAPTKLAFEYATDGAAGEKKRFNSPNDLAVHSNGTIFFTDPDWQAPNPKPQGAERSYRVKDGVVAHLTGSTVSKPNGILLSVDESSLYIGGSNGLFKYPLNADGTLGTEKRINDVSGGVDGMTKDCAGHIYAASGSSIVVLSPNDSMLGTISGINGATNVAFGGADSRTLFITSMQPPRLREVKLNVPGYPY